MTTIILADDHRIVRQGLRALLESEPDLQLVGETGDGLEAIQLTERLQPDVVVLDLMMSEMDGFRVLEQIKRNKEMRKIPLINVIADEELTAGEHVQLNGKVAALFQRELFEESELLQEMNAVLHRARKREEEKERGRGEDSN